MKTKTLTPDDNQNNKMWIAIQHALTRTGITFQRKTVTSLSACFILFLLSATAYAPTTDKFERYDAFFNGKGQTVVFSNGTTLHYDINGDTTSIMGGDQEGPWVVKESWGRLMVTVNAKEINITDALKTKGYFYYDYRDSAQVLHRLYIVKNAGGTKDYAERWYSQEEWLPEIGVAGGHRGISGPLGEALGLAELDAKENNEDLDAALKKRLETYWSEYGK